MLDIQKHGRWKSLTVFSYVGTTAAEQLAVTKSFLGEAKAAGAEGAAEAAAGKDDEVPSLQAHSLRAAAAGGKTGEKARKLTVTAAVGKVGRKRARQGSDGDDDDEEESTEAHQALDDEEEALFMAACLQGWREDEGPRWWVECYRSLVRPVYKTMG